MPERLYLSAAGQTFAAEVAGTRVTLRQAGPIVDVAEVKATGPHQVTVELPSGAFIGAVAAAGASLWVSIDGDVFEFRVTASAPGHASAREEDALTPPMSGTVTRVAVSPGQAVHRGDLLIAIEAMKMELAIRAPRDGVVTAIDCHEGDIVQAGRRVVELD